MAKMLLAVAALVLAAGSAVAAPAQAPSEDQFRAACVASPGVKASGLPALVQVNTCGCIARNHTRLLPGGERALLLAAYAGRKVALNDVLAVYDMDVAGACQKDPAFQSKAEIL